MAAARKLSRVGSKRGRKSSVKRAVAKKAVRRAAAKKGIRRRAAKKAVRRAAARKVVRRRVARKAVKRSLATKAVANATGSEIMGARLDESGLVVRNVEILRRGLCRKKNAIHRLLKKPMRGSSGSARNCAFLRRKKPRVAIRRVMMAGGSGAILTADHIRERMTGSL